MVEKSERLATQAGAKDRKAYEKPTLTKGPVLSDISAQVGSGER